MEKFMKLIPLLTLRELSLNMKCSLYTLWLRMWCFIIMAHRLSRLWWQHTGACWKENSEMADSTQEYADKIIVRWLCNATVTDGPTRRLTVDSNSEVLMMTGKLYWFGHVERNYKVLFHIPMYSEIYTYFPLHIIKCNNNFIIMFELHLTAFQPTQNIFSSSHIILQ